MQITVVIPTHGRQTSLAIAVNSALVQGERCAEVIVVDDGSSPPIEARALSEDPRLRVVRHAVNRGASAARNTGVAAAGTEAIAFLDSDDAWVAGKLERQAALLDGRDSVVVTGWVTSHRGAPLFMIPRPAGSLRDFSAGCWFSPGSTAVFGKSVFEKVGPFREDIRRLEDFEWYLRFARLGGQIDVVPEVLVAIRRHRSVDIEAVRTSVDAIAAAHLSAGAPMRLGEGSDRRRARSFLNLVHASAYWYGGAHLRAGWWMAASFAARPRLHLHSGTPIAISTRAGSATGTPQQHAEAVRLLAALEAAGVADRTAPAGEDG